MKCFLVRDNEVEVGIPANMLPCSKELFDISVDGVVTEASVTPATKIRQDIDLDELFAKNIHSASAICRTIFIPATTESNRILVGYNPSEYFLSRSRGDKTDLVYRSARLFVGLCSDGAMVLRPLRRNGGSDFVCSHGVPEKCDMVELETTPDEKDETNYIVTIE